MRVCWRPAAEGSGVFASAIDFRGEPGRARSWWECATPLNVTRVPRSYRVLSLRRGAGYGGVGAASAHRLRRTGGLQVIVGVEPRRAARAIAYELRIDADVGIVGWIVPAIRAVAQDAVVVADREAAAHRVRIAAPAAIIENVVGDRAG